MGAALRLRELLRGLWGQPAIGSFGVAPSLLWAFAVLLAAGCSGDAPRGEALLPAALGSGEPTAVVMSEILASLPIQLCLEGDTLVVVAVGEPLLVDDPANPEASIEYAGARAAVYVHEADGEWRQQAVLFPEGKTRALRWGESCALQGDRLVLGSPREQLVYVFERSEEGEWQQKSVISGESRHGFGVSIALDGSILAVGTSTEGQVYLYKHTDDGQWQHTQTLPSSDERVLSFGAAIALADGSLAVGAPTIEVSQGAVYLYSMAALGGEWVLEGRLESEPGALIEFTGFGSTLALDSGVLAVGAPETYSVLPFEETEEGFQVGAVHVFERDEGGSWAQVTQIQPNGEARLRDGAFWGFPELLGTQVAISGGVLVILAARERSYHGEEMGAATGALYVYAKEGGEWERQVRVEPVNDLGTGALFGRTMGFDSGRLAIGYVRLGAEAGVVGVNVY